MRFRCPGCTTITRPGDGVFEFTCPGCGAVLSTGIDVGAAAELQPDLLSPVPWDTWPVVGFDVETTGTDPLNDRIVSMAVVDLGRPEDSREWLVDPGVPIPEAASRVHGISTERAKTGTPAVLALGELWSTLAGLWSVGRTVAIYNAQFDLTIVQAELKRHGLPPLPVGTVIDPLVLWRRVERYRKGKKRLVDALERFEIDGGRPHEAANDARAAALLVAPLAQMAGIEGLSGSEVMQVQSDLHRYWAIDFADWLDDSGGDASDVRPEWPAVAV
jgi:DNA polymerase-3 subunit epsilon